MSRFSTPILATGSDSNTIAILGYAMRRMRQIGISLTERQALSDKVMAAGSRAEAIAAIEEWFPVDAGETRQ